MDHPTTKPEPTVFPSGADAPNHGMGPASLRFLLDASRGGAFSIIELRVPPGFSGPPMPHRHTREEASFVVVEGALTMTIRGEAHRVAAGGLAHLPRGVDFTWQNASAEQPARFLCVYAPGGFEQMFLDVERAFAAHQGPPTPEAMREIMPPIWRKYGLELARP